MAAPVKAPAAAPAAAPIDAPRTWPVAAPPMIAPVAAPHAAPWPTGVSHEVRVQKIRATPDATTTTISLLMMQIRSRIKLRSPPDVAGTLSRQPLSGRTRARDIQILSLHVRPGPTHRAQQPSSSHTVDMADMGSIQRPKDHAGYGSQADSGRLVPGIFFPHLLS
jgi:hypothetical protein